MQISEIRQLIAIKLLPIFTVFSFEVAKVKAMSDNLISTSNVEVSAEDEDPGETGKKEKSMTLTDLPEELLLYLASFLNGRDVVHLSHVNQVQNKTKPEDRTIKLFGRKSKVNGSFKVGGIFLTYLSDTTVPDEALNATIKEIRVKITLAKNGQ